jgi:hypothetical protein
MPDISLMPVGDNGLIFTPRTPRATAALRAVIAKNFEASAFKVLTGGGFLFHYPATYELKHFLTRAGLSYDRPPVRHGKWTITFDPESMGRQHYVAIHDDYDGAPMYSDGPPADNRCIRGESVAELIEEINAREEE